MAEEQESMPGLDRFKTEAGRKKYLAIVAACRNGETDRQVADRYQLSPVTVNQYRCMAGITANRPGGLYLGKLASNTKKRCETKLRVARALRGIRHGQTAAEAMNSQGLCNTVFQKWLRSGSVMRAKALRTRDRETHFRRLITEESKALRDAAEMAHIPISRAKEIYQEYNLGPLKQRATDPFRFLAHVRMGFSDSEIALALSLTGERVRQLRVRAVQYGLLESSDG